MTRDAPVKGFYCRGFLSKGEGQDSAFSLPCFAQISL